MKAKSSGVCTEKELLTWEMLCLLFWGSVLCFPKDCRDLDADPGLGWVTLLGQEGAFRGVLGETMQVIIPSECFPMGDCPVQLLIYPSVP